MHATWTIRLWPVAVAMATLLVSLPGPPAQAARDLPPRAMEAAARRAVHQRHGVPPGHLDVLNQVTTTYPTLDRAGVSFKLVDRRSGQPFTVLLGRDGTEWDAKAVDAQEQAAYDARYGRLEKGLFERLQHTPEDEQLDVVAWLRTERAPAPQAASGDELDSQQADAYFAQRASARLASIQSIQADLAPRLANWSGTAEYDSEHPVMHTRISARGVRAMGTWPELERVYLADRAQPLLDVADGVTRAVHVHSVGITGEGVRVAAIESGGHVAAGNPNLPGIVRDQENVCLTPDRHASAVAGVIGSNLDTHLGIAPGALLRVGGSCLGSTSELTAASTRASDWGASVFNLSFGSLTAGFMRGIDRYYDDLVYSSRRTVVAGAGNTGGGCFGSTDDHVISPGTAYNVITVGAFDDGNTVPFVNDAMWDCSSFDDPVSSRGDREKPELVAPGVRIQTLKDASSDTASFTGTSMAAPMVSGSAALLMQTNPTLLSRRPEAVKAILMATAIGNKEGDTRLSDKDGAGGVDADRAVQVARMSSPLRTFTPGTIVCGSNGTIDNVKEFARVTLSADQRLRVAIAWSTDPDVNGYPNVPSADLDLLVHRVSNNQQVALSASHDNTYEIVDFRAPVAGEYSLRTSTTCGGGTVIPLGRAIFGF